MTERNVEPNKIIDYLENYKNTDWENYAIWDPYRYCRVIEVGADCNYSDILEI